MHQITSEDELRSLLGEPAPAALAKERTALADVDRDWLAASPFCLVATSAADGSCDVSPKGDPPGFTLVLDDRTIALPERAGNRRTDGYQKNIPHRTSA
ncbi:pyridoxamine 5'-phosphate oxidase family protein [Blastococcus sp. SYSU DS0619]